MLRFPRLSRRRFTRSLVTLCAIGLGSGYFPCSQNTLHAADAAKKHIVLIAGPESHAFGEHEFGAGCELLADRLRIALPGHNITVCPGGWPSDPVVLESADAVIIYSDGEGRHVINGKEGVVRALHERGCGLGFVHYACNVIKGEQGTLMLDTIGGYYETGWSINPVWIANFTQLPEHPVTRGVQPFQLRDEWYYHMRFRENMQGVTPLLGAVPPEKTRQGRDGPHSGNPHVRARVGQTEYVAWVSENPNGSRGFGFTGAHFYWNYAQDDFRRFTLNAIAWLAKIDVPTGGLDSSTPDMVEMEKFITRRQPPADWAEKRKPWEAAITEWKNTPRATVRP